MRGNKDSGSALFFCGLAGGVSGLRFYGVCCMVLFCVCCVYWFLVLFGFFMCGVLCFGFCGLFVHILFTVCFISLEFLMFVYGKVFFRAVFSV